MDEKDFEILEVLAETKNITKAADILFTAQSVLSKRIMSIEAELGTKLMTRSRTGIHFTPEGEAVLRQTRKASSILREMREELSSMHDYVSGTLNAGISVNYAKYFLPSLLAVFRKDYPHVTTHINTDQSRNIFMKLLNNDIDIAIVRGSYDWKGESLLLSSENICAISSLEDRGKPLCEIPYIARRTDPAFEREIILWMRENDLHPEPDIYVDSIETCAEMVKKGLGWAIVPEICLNDFDGDIRRLSFSDGKPFIRPTYMLYSDEALKLRQVRAFIETVRKFHER